MGMHHNIIIKNNFIEISAVGNALYIQSFCLGFTMENFNQILMEHPEIKISNFMALRRVLTAAPLGPEAFGELRPPVEIEISNDELKAYMILYLSEWELAEQNRPTLTQKILDALAEQEIVFGIKHDVLNGNLEAKQKILIAEGIEPISGEHAKIKMYELKEPQPEILEDGNVNFYELNLINKVEKGDWLGERIDATSGIPGKTVLGKPIPSQPGKQLPLKYDPHSVQEVYDAEEKITTLIARKTGAVTYKNDLIMVYDYLEIHGDVSYETGNIEFDGFVNIKGAVEENFSVIAQKDIEIMGDFGLGAVEKIESKEGRIYIRGGIAGKGKAVIRTTKDLFTKFASDCTIICDGTVHIGFYCMNCDIIAKQVILQSHNSKIVGGNIQAEIKVAAAFIGNSMEKKTNIIIKGFDRKQYKEQFDQIIESLKKYNEELINIKQKVAIYGHARNLTPEQQKEYQQITERFGHIREALTALNEEKKKYSSYLRTKGEGEVQVYGRIYPNTFLEMKHALKRISRETTTTTFFLQDGTIKEA